MEQKKKIIKEISYDEQDVHDIFDSSPPFYSNSYQKNKNLLVELWMGKLNKPLGE